MVKSAPKEESSSQQIDAITRKSNGWRGKKLSQLRTIIRKSDDRIVEEVKWKRPSKPEGVPVWSCNGIICVADTLKNAVHLTFPKGAQIKDQKKLFNTRLDSNSVRAIDFHLADEINGTALKNLVRAAVDLNVEKE